MKLKERKAFRLYRALAEDEVPRFESFMLQVHLAQKGLVKQVYQELKKNEAAIEKQEYSEKELFSTLFPHDSFQPETVRRILNRLVVTIKNFWYFEANYAKDPQQLPLRQHIHYKLDLMEELLRRGILSEYPFEKKGLERLMKQFSRDPEWYECRNRFLELENQYQQITKPRRPRPELAEMEENMHRAYLLGLLRVQAARLNQSRMTDNAYQPVPGQLSHFLTNKLSHFPDARAYQLYIDVEVDLSQTRWEKRLREFELLREQCARNTVQEVLKLMLSAAIRRMNAGNLGFHHKVWEIYLLLLQEGFLGTDSSIRAHHFINLVQLAFHRGQESFVLNLLDLYRNSFIGPRPEGTILLIEGFVAMGKKEWDKSEGLFRRVRIESQYQIERLIARANLAKVHFEQGKLWEVIDEDCASAKMVFQRGIKKSQLPLKNLANFNRILRKVANRAEKILHRPLRRTEIEKLVQEINHCPELLYREWLREKCDELLTKLK